MISNAALPRKRRDSVKLTALSTAIPRNTRTERKLATRPMHQIQPNRSIKDYLRDTDVKIEHKLKTSKEKHPEG